MLNASPAAPEFTLAEISGAVSRITGLPTEHAEVARYSGNLLGLMNSNPALRMAGPNSPAIADYIRQFIPAELAEKADPARRAEMDQARTADHAAALTGALAFRNGLDTLAALRNMPGGTGDRRSDGRDGASPSSAAYDGMPPRNSPEYYTTPRGQAEMRSYASSLGMSWVGNRPELLGLGPSAIKALADVQLKKESYDKLRTDAAFEPKDVVTLAEYAKRKNIDANKAADDLAEANKGLSTDEKHQHNEALKGVMKAKKPEEEAAAKKNLEEVQKKLLKEHPEKHEPFKKLNKTLKIKREQAANAENRADLKDIKAHQKTQQANQKTQQADQKTQQADQKTQQADQKQNVVAAAKGSVDDLLADKPVEKSANNTKAVEKPAGNEQRPMAENTAKKKAAPTSKPA